MAVYFTTSNPSALLKKFKDAIQQDDAVGKITTWELDSDGDVTHKADQWAKKCWLRPSIAYGQLVFNTIPPKDQNISITVYGYYHGHIIETFLNHFDKDFLEAKSTALPKSPDQV